MADLVSEAPARTPRYVLALLAWLPDEGPAAASIRGGRQWLGWSRQVQVAADTWDLHAAVAVAQGGKKAARKKAPTYPRPKAAVAARERPRRRLSAFPGAIDTRQFPQPPPGA